MKGGRDGGEEAVPGVVHRGVLNGGVHLIYQMDIQSTTIGPLKVCPCFGVNRGGALPAWIGRGGAWVRIRLDFLVVSAYFWMKQSEMYP